MNGKWHELPVLNLTPGFEPFGPSTAGEVTYIDYPSGVEPHVRIKANDWPDGHSCRVLFTARPTNPTDLMRVFLAPSALGEGSHVELFMPYMPHARQDRRAVPADAFSLEVMIKLLQASGYSRLHVFDLHNPEALNSVRWYHRSYLVNYLPTHFLENLIRLEESSFGKGINALVVVPDRGMSSRILQMVAEDASHQTDFAKMMIQREQLVCEKHRDPERGGLRIYIPHRVNPKDRVCVIIDDICDGGGTFIPVVAALKERGAKRVVLASSHGLFTKGYRALKKAGLDAVYTTNSWPERPLDTRLNRRVSTDWKMMLGL